MRPQRYVVDASVAVKWVVPEPGSDRAQMLFEAAVEGRADLLAPDVFVPEVANVIWKRCRLRGDLTEDQARDAVSTLLRFSPELVRSDLLAAQALELALAFRRPVYDCLYVALAVRDGCTLVTADQRLAAALGPATGRVMHLDDFTGF